MTEPYITSIGPEKISMPIATGSMTALRDGRIMWAWGHKQLWANHSSDGGRTWSNAVACKTSGGESIPNGGGVSLLRLASGKLALAQVSESGGDGLVSVRQFTYCTSEDEGDTWSSRVPINPPGKREVLMMDCLVQLSTGRLILPCSVIMGPIPTPDDPAAAYRFGERFGNCWSYNTIFCFCYFSDDEGRTWQRSGNEVHATLDRGVGGGYSMDEAMVAELDDGRLLMMANSSLGRLFKSYSHDGGESWREAEPTDLVQRRSALNLKRIAGSKDLLVIWNQVSNWEQMNGLFRHRLSCAVSSDNGESWHHHRNLESFDDVCKLEPEPLESWLLGKAHQPYDRDRYHRAPGALKKDHPSCYFHNGTLIISYGANALGDPDVIEKIYGMTMDEAAERAGFSRGPRYGDPNVYKSKWFHGVNRVQVVPIPWLYG